ncbi:CAP domain-containing protein [Mucor mucedo]|uniref:CAP domain-containing protein n=1 Tax=Mucor mucedo TaxID=29922 RepID=UPI002220997D|nr:CAP domain-containing protein [Mucor mucedo]KAI7868216.1 CAP domain-containing protein [Mucor mucedo]
MVFSSHLFKLGLTIVTVSQLVTGAPSDSLRTQALNTHNKYRARHHVPGVKWNQNLANHATRVSQTCNFKHVLPNTGQNISRGYPSMEAAIDDWYNEVRNYNYNTGSNKPGSSTGHFTQVVWKGTTQIGCGATYCNNYRQTFYVCNYNPSGNYNGQNRANVIHP